MLKNKSILCLQIQFAVKIGDYLKYRIYIDLLHLTLFWPGMLTLLHFLCPSAERF